MTEQEVQRIVGLIEALQKSSFDELELEVDGLKLTLGRGGSSPSVAAAAATPSKPTPPLAIPPVGKEASPAPSTPSAAPISPKAPNAHVAGAKDVLTPLRGIFYGRPDPASPPFATVGAKVSAINTIGLVEVMKVFNAIPAGHDGVVVEICVEDGQAVDAGQVLLRIKAEP